MELSNLYKILCKEKFQAKMGLEHVICEIVLHTALPSELSTSGSWANAILYPILRTSTLCM